MTPQLLLEPLFSTIWALVFLFSSSLLKSLLSLNLLPRLQFSKIEMTRTRQIFLRWVLVCSRLRIKIKRDFLFIIVLSLQVTCLAIFPINGEYGLKVANPVAALLIICLVASVTYIFASRQAQGGAMTDKSVDQLVYFSSQALIVIVLFMGAALGQPQGELSDFLGREWLLIASPFHLLAFFIGVFIATFHKSVPSSKEQVINIEAFIPKTFSLIWITLFVMVFLNSNTLPGLPHFIFLVTKVTLIYLILEILWKHVPVLRRDQLEKLVLIVIYPLTFVSFIGMWWMSILD